jgi:transposase InsO family protein
LRAFAAQRARWGYRRAHYHLLQEGWQVNRKRVQRVWREEGLRVPRTRRRKRAVGEGADGRDINEDIAAELNAKKVPAIHGTNRWTAAAVRKAFVS